MRRFIVAILLALAPAMALGLPPVPLAGIVAVDSTGKTIGAAVGCQGAALCAVALSLDGRLLLVGVGTPAAGVATLRGADSDPYTLGDVFYSADICGSAPYLVNNPAPDSDYVAGKYVVMGGSVYVSAIDAVPLEREMRSVRHSDGLCVQLFTPTLMDSVEASSLGSLGLTEPFHFAASTIVFIDGFAQTNLAEWSGVH